MELLNSDLDVGYSWYRSQSSLVFLQHLKCLVLVWTVNVTDQNAIGSRQNMA